MEELESIKNIVKDLLERIPETRNSDKFLIFKILQEFTNINIPFKEFDERFPFNFESIRRCRQLIQVENPNLRAEEQIENLRENRKEEFKRFFAPRTRGIEINNLINTRTKGIEVFE